MTTCSPVSLLTQLCELHRLSEADTLSRALTDRYVKNKKPDSKPIKVADGGGLTLYVPPSGNKVWHYRFRLAGKPQTYTLGPFPEVGLATARNMHRAAVWLVERGIHPRDYVADKQAEAAVATAKSATFEDVCREWLRETETSIAKTSAENRESMLRNYVFSEVGERPFIDVRRKDLAELLAKVDALHPVTAKHCRTHLKMLFDWACDREIVDGNRVPTARVLVHNARRKVKPHKAMSVEGLPAFMKTLDAATETHALTKLAFRLLLLSWCRTQEVVGARWEEVDLKAANWTIPAHRMKGRIEHCVRLPMQAVELFRELEKWRDPKNPDFVFPGARGKGHMSRGTMREWLKRWGFSSEASVHGFRATSRTWASKHSGHSDKVCELALSHQVKDPVQAAYDRNDHAEDLRDLLQQWADKVDELYELSKQSGEAGRAEAFTVSSHE